MAKQVVDKSSYQRLLRLSRLLDSAFEVPGTRFRIGFDALIGLIPGIGDLAGGAVSLYIVVEAARLGVPIRGLILMIFNILVELVIGIVPVAGDLFDAAWKTNLRNMEIIERYVEPVAGAPAPSNGMARLGAALLAIIALAASVVGMTGRALVQFVQGLMG